MERIFYQAFLVAIVFASCNTGSHAPERKPIVKDTLLTDLSPKTFDLGKPRVPDSIIGFWRQRTFLFYDFAVERDSIFYLDSNAKFSFRLYDRHITINHTGYIDTVGYMLKGDTLFLYRKDTMECFRTCIMDTGGKIVRGKSVLALSPVCYYFDSLLHTPVGNHYSCMGYGCYYQVSYVPDWDTWITDGAVDGEGYNLVPVFTDSSSAGDQDNFISRADLQATVENDILQLETNNNAPSSALHVSLQAKVYFDAKGKPVLGIQTSQEGRYAPETGTVNFYYLAPGGWEEITNDVIQTPRLQDFFEKRIDTNLVNKYGYVHVSFNFVESCDTLILVAYLNDEFDFDPPMSDVKITESEKNRLKEMFGDDSENFKDILFLFNKYTRKFKRIGTVKKM